MKPPKSEPFSTQLDPSHPNYDAILLKRARLEAHRRRRLENSGALVSKAPAPKSATKPTRPLAGARTIEALIPARVDWQDCRPMFPDSRATRHAACWEHPT